MHLCGIVMVHLTRKIIVILLPDFCNFENIIGFKMPVTFYEVLRYIRTNEL